MFRVVYVLQAANGFLKFGCTYALRSRMVAIQALAPEPLQCVAWARGDRAIESALHARLAPARRHGEWFAPTPEALAVVRSFGRIVATIRRTHGRFDPSSWRLQAEDRLINNARRAELRAGGAR